MPMVRSWGPASRGSSPSEDGNGEAVLPALGHHGIEPFEPRQRTGAEGGNRCHSSPLCGPRTSCVQPVGRKPQGRFPYSAEGMRGFSRDFAGSRSDYEKMIELNPKLEVSHWRLGIAYFYLKEYPKVPAIRDLSRLRPGRQGEWNLAFHVPVQGKWSQGGGQGFVEVREGRLPPYPWLYEMYAGRLEPGKVSRRSTSKVFPNATRSGFFSMPTCTWASTSS